MLGESLERFRGIELPDYAPLSQGYIADIDDVVIEENRKAEARKADPDGEEDDDDEEDAESGGGRNWNETPFDY